MIVATTSLSIALWKRYSLIDVARWNSKKDAWQMLSLCCHMDNIRSRWTPRCLTDVLTGTQFPPMFAHSLSTKATRDAEPTGITYVSSVFNLSLLLFIQIRTSPIHVWIQDWTLSNWLGRSTVGQLCVICILVIVTITDRNHIWQRLWVQSEPNWS